MNFPEVECTFLGVFFNEKVTFRYHIENMCIKASRKLQALALVAP